MIQPTPLDVLCGRDKISFNHAGNRRFREIIASHLNLYNTAPTRKKKTKVVVYIVEKIRASGGRFLKYNKAENRWYEPAEKICREKVGHALRDKTPNNVGGNSSKAQSPASSNEPAASPAPTPSVPAPPTPRAPPSPAAPSALAPSSPPPVAAASDGSADDDEVSLFGEESLSGVASVAEPTGAADEAPLMHPELALSVSTAGQASLTTPGHQIPNSKALSCVLNDLGPSNHNMSVASMLFNSNALFEGSLLEAIIEPRPLASAGEAPLSAGPPGPLAFLDDGDIDQGLMELDQKYECESLPAAESHCTQAAGDQNKREISSQLRNFLDYATTL